MLLSVRPVSLGILQSQHYCGARSCPDICNVALAVPATPWVQNVGNALLTWKLQDVNITHTRGLYKGTQLNQQCTNCPV